MNVNVTIERDDLISLEVANEVVTWLSDLYKCKVTAYSSVYATADNAIKKTEE